MKKKTLWEFTQFLVKAQWFMEEALWFLFSELFGMIFFPKKFILLFSKDALHLSTLTVNRFIMLQTFLFQINAVLLNFLIKESCKKTVSTKILSITTVFNIDDNKCFSILMWFQKDYVIRRTEVIMAAENSDILKIKYKTGISNFTNNNDFFLYYFSYINCDPGS